MNIQVEENIILENTLYSIFGIPYSNLIYILPVVARDGVLHLRQSKYNIYFCLRFGLANVINVY